MPAGERARVIALRRRVAQQQGVVTAHRLRDARMAALVRAMNYSGRAVRRWVPIRCRSAAADSAARQPAVQGRGRRWRRPSGGRC
ncbi:hypothetical protein [Mycobacterium sp. IS-1496]|uniref:hypothetical protein n=1 Tax=Mycobacterium sp. IS-1496 TaxID=1772284 RepID=UPI0012F9EE76|nr:hypothetical protein [Mycobacterium sp. IS-1496]